MHAGYGFDDSKQCVKCSVGCFRCDENYKECTYCSDGYGLDDSKQCVKCLDNCYGCNKNYKECTSCSDGYGFDDSKQCVKCSVGCSRCNENYKECTLCSTGYGFDESKQCVKCKDDHCSQCWYDYTICNDLLDNCLIQGEGKCVECKRGYGFDNSNNCVRCLDAFCSKCNKYSECEKCFESYGLDSNKQCKQCTVVGCKECLNGPESCSNCENGYLEYDEANQNYNKCFQISNCDNLIYENDNIACERCKAYFGKNEKNECVPCKDQNCVNCFDDYSVCSSCAESLVADNNKDSTTYGECISCKVQNCAQCYSSIDKCDICMDGYHGDGCQKCADNCRRCNNDGACTEPMPGYYINEEGQLNKCSQGCVRCKDNTTCYECGSKNALYKNECISLPHNHCDYLFVENGELICVGCEEGYYLVDNQFNKIDIPNCISFYDSKCQFCESGYALINNECKKCKANCSSCNDNVDKCILCDYGFYLQDDECLDCNKPNCAYCAFIEPHSCLTCHIGFALDVRPDSETFGNCFQCDVENCLNCGNYMDGSDRCNRCKEGFILAENNKKCIPDEFGGNGENGGNSGNDKNDGGGSQLSTGAIVGIVVGCVVAVGLIIFLLVFFLVIKKKKVSVLSSQDE